MGAQDVILWPDGTWCYGDEIWEMGFMSDDYRVLRFGTLEYIKFFKGESDE